MDSVNKAQAGKLPSSLSASPHISALSMPVLKQTLYNSDPSCKNKFAPTAFKEERMNLTQCFFVSVFLFLLGSVFSMIFVHSYITDTSTLVPPIKEVIQPVIITETELSLDSFINYASLNNHAKIIDEESTPEYHGAFSILSNNQRESAISDENFPGKCWAFEGQNGYLAIKLAYMIFPTQFFIQHINVKDI